MRILNGVDPAAKTPSVITPTVAVTVENPHHQFHGQPQFVVNADREALAKRLYRRHVYFSRITTSVIGVALVLMSLYSHLNSAWNQWIRFESDNSTLKFYQICMVDPYKSIIDSDRLSCPNISMERFFVGVVCTTCILSIIGLIASIWADLSPPYFKIIDMGYHAASSALLLIGAFLYVLSAKQVKNLSRYYYLDGDGFEYLHWQKFCAGLLGIIQAALYCRLVFQIRKQ